MTRFENQTPGYELGSEAIDQVINHAEQYCECEKQRIEAVNQPEINACRGELILLQQTEQALSNELPAMRQPADANLSRRRIYNLIIAGLLTSASLALLVFAFEKFRFGWKLWTMISGIAVTAPFAIDHFLHHWLSARLLRVSAAVLLAVSLPSVVLLAELRAELLAREITTTNASVTFDDDTPTSQPENDFASRAAMLLGLAMTFLSLSLELGAGLALHEFHRASDQRAEGGERIRIELVRIRARMIALLVRINELQNEPRVWCASFWRDFYRVLLTRTARRAIAKVSMICMLAIVITGARAQPAYQHQTVIVLDSSQTEAVPGYGGRNEFQENINAIGRFLATIPAGSELTILGITDGAGPPDILLSAQISADEGYFGERLAAARKALFSRWRKRTAELRPSFPHTDLFGALAVASDILVRSLAPDKRILAFSDMRHETKGFNLEGPRAINVPRMMSLVRERHFSVPLTNTRVYVMGAHAAGRDLTYWSSLRDFWSQYFHASGATLGEFSMTREVANLSQPR